MKTLTLTLDSASYPIMIDAGLMKGVAALLKKENLGGRYVIISDSTVAKLYGTDLEQSMKKEGLDVSLLSFPAGEEHKHLKTYTALQEQLFELGCDRSTTIIALGGGVVGDVAGFVAATYMRGIPVVQIPTTLLAMVDASIGGKTGVDLETGKNIVGVFHQPRMVLIDPEVLGSLEADEIKNGLAECVKHGCIADVTLLDFIETKMDAFFAGTPGALAELIFRNCSIKVDVVMQDEKESGIRKMLNYGHTFGHALEVSRGYATISHGAAIALGMVVAARLSVSVGRLSKLECDRQIALLERIGFKITLADDSVEDIIKLMKKDKKMIDGALKFVLLERLGKVDLDVAVTDADIAAVMRGMA